MSVSLSISERPNLPASSPYMMFIIENRERIKSEIPILSVAEISKRGVELWEKLSPIEQYKYTQKARDGQQIYKQILVQAKFCEAREQQQRQEQLILLQKQKNEQAWQDRAKMQHPKYK